MRYASVLHRHGHHLHDEQGGRQKQRLMESGRPGLPLPTYLLLGEVGSVE
jgi:hypothetical protein